MKDLIKNHLKLFIAIIIIMLIFCYFFLNPLFISSFSIFRPHNIKGIDYANKYYSMLSSVFGLFIGCLGLILGAFYYDNRNRIEKNQKKREQQRVRLELFMVKLNAYDKIICEILSKRIEDEIDLAYQREQSQKTNDEINLILDQGLNLLGFSNSDVSLILKINSFVEKSTEIFHCNYADFSALDKQILTTLKEKYSELINNGRQVCYKRMV